MTALVFIVVVSVLALVVGARDHRRDRDDARRKLICMRVGCGHTFLDHTPECQRCICQETSYQWVDQ